MTNHDYQVAVIGAGPGGYVAAIRAAQLGLKTVVIDKGLIGGICLHCGCIPSKALIHASHVFEQIQQAGQMGIEVENVSLNGQQLQAWKSGVIKKMEQGIRFLFKKNQVNLKIGVAYLKDAHTVSLQTENGQETLTAENIILATGSRSIAIPGLEDEHVITSTEALDFQEFPEHLIVVGGGYIGLEIGMFCAKFGSQVTVVEMMDQLLPQTESDLVKVVERQLKKLKVKVVLQAKAKSYQSGQLMVETGEGEQWLKADKVLVAVGRKPNVENLGLEALGIEMVGSRIHTDQQMRTSVPNIYAIGDIVEGPMLAHKASREGMIAAEAIAGKPSYRDFKVIPAVVFTDPEIASVGMTETEAREAGYEIAIGKFPFAALGKAVAVNAAEGFVKVIAEKQSGLLLGVHMVGNEVSNLISEAALALEMGAVAQDLGLTIHPHPTLSEALMEACEAIYGHAIHVA